MAQRGAGARFMGGAWVFPGGVVDAADGEAPALAALNGSTGADAAWRAAALREMVEETGIWFAEHPFVVPADRRLHGAEVYASAAASPERRFDAGALQYFSNWVTPSVVPVRFDARFYVATVDHGIEGIADGREMDAVEWVHPQTALADSRSAGMVLPLPTRKTLQHFSELGSPQAIVDFATAQTAVPPIQPRLRTRDDGSLDARATGRTRLRRPHRRSPGSRCAATCSPRHDARRRVPSRSCSVVKIDRVLAPNPGPYTGPGTNTYVVEDDGRSVVIDPGPVIASHLAAIEHALGDSAPVAVLVTHTHPDHAPAANPLARRAWRPGPRLRPGSRPSYPTHAGRRRHRRGWRRCADRWCTPPVTRRTTSATSADGVLFTGDHIMGGSTVIIEDAADYMASLRRVRELDPHAPLSGSRPRDPGRDRHGRGLHRSPRGSANREIIAAVADGAESVQDIVSVVYAGLDAALVPAAIHQVGIQLQKLAAEGRVEFRPTAREGEPSPCSCQEPHREASHCCHRHRCCSSRLPAYAATAQDDITPADVAAADARRRAVSAELDDITEQYDQAINALSGTAEQLRAAVCGAGRGRAHAGRAAHRG